MIHVRRGVVRSEGHTIVGKPKSDAGTRDVAIPPHLVPMLKAHRDACRPGRRRAPLPRRGRRLAPRALNALQALLRGQEAAGRPDLRWHDLRHTGAVLAAQTGATLAELMGRLGHSTPAAAMRYQHIAGGRDAEIAAALSKLARGG